MKTQEEKDARVISSVVATLAGIVAVAGATQGHVAEASVLAVLAGLMVWANWRLE